ncbi:MAG: alpha/beta hydrolase [Pirellulales bacterium]
MRRSAFFVAALAGAWCLSSVVGLSAAETNEIPLWAGKAPGETAELPPEAAQPGRPNDTTIRIGNVSSPTITVFPAPKDKATGAAVIICPGGGYNILAFNKEGTEVAEWLNSIGVTGIVLKYRVPKRPDRERHAPMLEDAQRAIGMVRHRASEWGIDPARIGILGFSAGGHLAATASNNYAKRTYAKVDAADDVSCRPDFAVLIYPAYLVDKENKLAAELPVSKETPPTFIAMTEDDGVRVECGLFYYLALKEAKVKAEMHLYPTGGHGYGLRPSEHLVSSWPARAGDWLKTLGRWKRSSPPGGCGDLFSTPASPLTHDGVWVCGLPQCCADAARRR